MLSPKCAEEVVLYATRHMAGVKRYCLQIMASVKVKETVSFSIQDLNERHIGLVFFIGKAPGNLSLYFMRGIQFIIH